jgi:hypothetical protein
MTSSLYAVSPGELEITLMQLWIATTAASGLEKEVFCWLSVGGRYVPRCLYPSLLSSYISWIAQSVCQSCLTLGNKSMSAVHLKSMRSWILSTL